MVSGVKVSKIIFSDHNPIICTWSCKIPKPKKGHTTVEYRSFKKFDENAFIHDLHLAPFGLVIQENDVNVALSAWYDILNPIIDKHAPVRKRRVKHPEIPAWMNQDITKAMEERDFIKDTFGKTAAYKRQRNVVTKLVRDAKKALFTQMIERDCSPGQHWKAMNEITDKTHKRANNYVPCSPDAFNDFFLSLASTLTHVNDPPPPPSPILKTFCQSKLNESKSCIVPEISIHDVRRSIKNLKSKKSMGPDNISAYLLKLCLPYIDESLTHVYNLSIRNNTFPDKFKDAKVIPLPKTKEVTGPNDFRPISLLSVISKPLEKHIHHHVQKFVEKNELIHDFQSGFRQAHSCHTALVRLCDTWLNAINDKKLTGAVFLDFKKAFDLVNHDILLQKLNMYLQSNSTVSLLKSFLSERTQHVYVNGTHSYSGRIKSGVPQGSVLGPLLFCLFINDLPKHFTIPEVCCDLFADDSTLHTSSDKLDTISSNLQQTLNDVSLWCKSNRMILHPQKTKCMVITSRQKHQLGPLPLNLCIASENVEQVEHHRVLGVIIDCKMQWREHISYVCKKVSRNLFLLKKLRRYVDSDSRKRFFYAHCLSHINYASTIWSEAADLHLIKLNSLHRRGGKLISSEDNLPTAVKLKSLDIIPLASQFDLNFAVLVLKIRLNKAPQYLSKFLIDASTRYGSLRYIYPKAKIDLMESSFGFRGASVWNSLPSTLKTSTSVIGFKKRMRKHLTLIGNTRFS